MMRAVLAAALGAVLMLGCSLDPFGFLASSDVDERFNDGLSLPAPTNLSLTPPYSFVVIADTHVHDAESAARVASLSLKLIAADEFVLAAGDLVQNGLRSDVILFTNAMREATAALGIPWFAVPGNHDLYFGGWTNFREHIGRSIYSFSAGALRVIAMDSANGTLGKKQYDWLSQTLASRSEAHCIVFTHFQFFSPAITETQQYTDIEEAAYLMYLFETRSVSYVLSGHSHADVHHMINGVSYLTVANHPASIVRMPVTATNMTHVVLH